MLHKVRILDLEALLAEDLEGFFPQRSGLNSHLACFTYLHLDGETQTTLQGRALQNFQKRYQEGQTPLFVPLGATLTFSNPPTNELSHVSFTPFGPLRPPPLKEHPLKPYILALLHHLAKKTIH